MDETLAAIVRGAEADPNVVVAFLHGSRAAGHERPERQLALFEAVRQVMDTLWKDEQLR